MQKPPWIIEAEFQSTRPRRARPRYATQVITAGTVSIHAPAEGATAAAGRAFG